MDETNPNKMSSCRLSNVAQAVNCKNLVEEIFTSAQQLISE